MPILWLIRLDMENDESLDCLGEEYQDRGNVDNPRKDRDPAYIGQLRVVETYSVNKPCIRPQNSG